MKKDGQQNSSVPVSANYHAWLESLKKQIQSARARTAMMVNAELINLYHKIGLDILQQQQTHRWGDKIIQRLAADLKTGFPDMKGFSTSNLKYMRYFAEQCPLGLIGQQPADQLPWFHIVTIKASAFKPEYTGQLNFYLSAVDAQIKASDDRSTIGLLLCKSRNKIVAEYALRNVNSPIGVAEYKLVASLPRELKTELPSIEEIEIRLAESAKLPVRKKKIEKKKSGASVKRK
jgi:hypothetical protein